jgi:hypothetical protein
MELVVIPFNGVVDFSFLLYLTFFLHVLYIVCGMIVDGKLENVEGSGRGLFQVLTKISGVRYRTLDFPFTKQDGQTLYPCHSVPRMCAVYSVFHNTWVISSVHCF